MTHRTTARATAPGGSRTIVVAMTALAALMLGTIGAAAQPVVLPANPAPAGTCPLMPAASDLEVTCEPETMLAGETLTCIAEDDRLVGRSPLFVDLDVSAPWGDHISDVAVASVEGNRATVSFTIPDGAQPGFRYAVTMVAPPSNTSCYAIFEFTLLVLNGTPPSDDDGDPGDEDENGAVRQTDEWRLAGPGLLEYEDDGFTFTIRDDPETVSGPWIDGGSYFAVADLGLPSSFFVSDVEGDVIAICDGGLEGVALGSIDDPAPPVDEEPVTPPVSQPTDAVPSGPDPAATDAEQEVAVDDTAATRLPDTGADTALLVLLAVFTLLGGAAALARRPDLVRRG